MRAASGLWVVLLAAGALTGGSAAAPAGWTSHRVAAAGFALATPASWVDATSTTTSTVLALVAKKYPQLAATIQLARSTNLVKLLCFSPAGYPNVSVAEEVTPGITLGELVAENVAAVRQLPAVVGRISELPVTLPAGHAILLRYEVAVATHTVAALQYVLLRTGRAYVVTYSTMPSPGAATLALIERSVRSFRYLGTPTR